MSAFGVAPKSRPEAAGKISGSVYLKRGFPFALAAAIWFTPVPAGLTVQAWHLFAVFVSAISRCYSTYSRC